MKDLTSHGRRLLGALPLALLLLTPGCAGYRLGSTLPPDIRSVHVPTFINRSGEPQVEGEATRAAIQEFQRDGTLKVVDREQADTIVAVTLTGYRLDPVLFARDNTKTPTEYRIRLTAEMTMTRAKTGAVLAQQKVTGETTFSAEGGLTAARLQAQPEAFRDLAHNVVERVVEFW